MKTAFFHSSQSVWRLPVVFIIALIIFVGFRFEAESLIRAKVIEMASQSGMQLQFDQVNVMGWIAGFHHVSIASERLPIGLSFEQVEISPSWGSLLTGKLAINVELIWAGGNATVSISQSGEYISIQDIDVQTGIADVLQKAKPFLHLPVPVDVSGGVKLEGEILLDRKSGMPQSGALSLYWQGAKFGMMGEESALGNLSLQVQSKAPQWEWLIQDEGTGFIDAKGVVQQQGAQMARWPITGSAVIHVSKLNDPSLLALVSGFGAAGEMRLNVSGMLFRPRLDVLK